MVITKVCCCSVGTVGKLDRVFLKLPSETEEFLKKPSKKQVDTNEILKLYSHTSHNITLHFVSFEISVRPTNDSFVAFINGETFVLFDEKICY